MVFIFDGLPIGFMFFICYYHKPSTTKNSRLEYQGCAYEVPSCERCGVANSCSKCADLDEMPSSLGLGIYLKLLCLPSPGESFPCYFNLNGVFIATHFETIQNMGFLTQHRRRPPIPFHILF